MLLTRKTRESRDTIIRYYGGKAIYSKWLCRWFPKHHNWVDVCGGSGAVTLNKPQSPVEVYNDIDPAPVNFLRQIRDNHLALTTAVKAIEPTAANFVASTDWQGGDDVERAARYFLRQRASFSGESLNTSSYGFLGQYGEKKLNNYWRKVDKFSCYSGRFSQVILCNESFDTLIPSYDAPDTLYYIDPPYNPNMRSNRGQRCYRYEMTEADHERLCHVLLRCKGMVVLSGYDRNYKTGAYNTTYNDILRGWAKVCLPAMALSARWSKKSKTPKYREEALWINPAAYYALERNNL